MPDYTFETLSPLDFENIIRDLIQSELSIRLESFKTGRDLGIDFRYSKSDTSDLIIQAKHYAGTGLSGLLSHLKSKEKPKIDKLQPGRYILATSVPLSPMDKNLIFQALNPHIQQTGDIYGKDDLNNLLGLFPDIEKQHFKLWLSSTTILEEILHSKILNQTRITLHEIRDKARVYVANQSFKEALNILEKFNYVIIAGIPGIGKTTLANMIVLHFLKSDYNFIDVSYDINEAYSIPDNNSPKIYMYDDFLGRTSIDEKLQKNEDHRLSNFISSIRKTKSSKLILTTREYILHQAQTTYEILNGPLFEKPQCIIDLSQYTRPIRAQILYNHLYFSQLPKEHIKELVNQTTYLNIIDHPNYSPRIIEYMTDPMWTSPEDPKNYPANFLSNLKKPFLIWEQVFNNQISDTAREVLLVLGSLPSEVFLEDLECAVAKLLEVKGYDQSNRLIHRSFSELQGNFIVLRRDKKNDIVSFHNPSVQDFIESYIDNNPSLYEVLILSVCFYEQVQWLCKRAKKKGYTQLLKDSLMGGLKSTLHTKSCTLINFSIDQGRTTYKERWSIRHASRLQFIATLLESNELSFMTDYFRDLLNDFINKMPGINIDNWDLLALSQKVIEMDCMKDIKNEFLTVAKESIFENTHWLSDASYIIKFLKLNSQSLLKKDQKRLIKKVQDIVSTYSYKDHDTQTLNDELSRLEEMQVQLEFDFQEEIATVEELLSEAEEDYSQKYNEEYHGTDLGKKLIKDDILNDMFATLLN